MDTKDVAQSLARTLKHACPGIELDHSMNDVEIKLQSSLDEMLDDHQAYLILDKKKLL